MTNVRSAAIKYDCENIFNVSEITVVDKMQTIHTVCESVRLSYRTCQMILVNVRWFPKTFVLWPFCDQWEHQVQVSMEFQHQFKKDPNFWSKVITYNKSWIVMISTISTSFHHGRRHSFKGWWINMSIQYTCIL